MNRLLSGCLLGLFALTAQAKIGPPVVKEVGACRLLLHHYEISAKDQSTLSAIITDLIRSHEKAFDFTGEGYIRVQIRIFGREDDFNEYAQAKNLNEEGRVLGKASTNIAGYYSGLDHEVVTWRQHHPSYLANNILHECSHAILHSQFRTAPIWLVEGCAVYFEFPHYMRDESDERHLKAKWFLIQKMLNEEKLPKLRDFLNISEREFGKQPPAQTYTVSWSLFQLLMSTKENRRAMNEMLRHLQKPSRQRPDCAALLDASYPGGLAKMDKDWRAWIKAGAAKVLGDKAK